MVDTAVLAANFLLGLFAFFAPCGFPMLPAYMAYYVARPPPASDPASASASASAFEPLPRRLARGLGAGALAALGAFAVLLAIGWLAVTLGAPFKQRVAWLELLGGLVVIALGVMMILGRGMSLKVALRPSQSKSALSLVGFGALYAATASSCVAPVLIGVLFPAFTSASLADGLLQVGAYAAGMSLLLVAASVAVAASQERLLRSLRRLLPHVEKALGALLVAVGAYLLWYWAATQYGIPAPPSLPAP